MSFMVAFAIMAPHAIPVVQDNLFVAPIAEAGANHISDLMQTIDWQWIIVGYIKSLISAIFKPCFCGNWWFGFEMDYWNTIAIVENTDEPGYIPLLGIKIPLSFSPLKDPDNSDQTSDGANDDEGGQKQQVRHNHFWNFPLLAILDFLACTSGVSGISPAYMSELDVLWAVPEMAATLNPLILLLSNVMVSLAGIADCASVSILGNNAISDKMFFFLGCWGPTYPASGRVAHNAGVLESDLSFLGKSLAKAHMIAAAYATTVEHAGQLCYPIYFPVIPKNEYLFSFIYPSMLVRSNTSKMAIGITPLLLPEVGLSIPFKEGESVFLLYKHVQCCMFN